MRVLFLTHRLPYPTNRGDRLRSFNIIRRLSATMDVEVVSLAHDADEETAHADLLRGLFPIRLTTLRTNPVLNYLRAAAALAGSQPLTHCLLDAPGASALFHEIARDRPPDVVLAYCSGMARFAMEPPLDAIPMVLDMVDVDSEKWASLARTTSWPKGWIYRREANYLGRFEARAANLAAANVVVNTREREALLRLAPRANVHVVGLGVDFQHLQPLTLPSEAPRVIFCGVMNYQPNVDGVLWFAREVWPGVLARRPDARFIVVGSNPAGSIRQLASARSGIDVTGTVPDVREYLWGAAVSVAPLWTARGLQNKVLEALAAGLPTVITPQVREGLPPGIDAGCLTVASAEAFANEILSLLALAPHERRAIASRAPLESIGWDAQLASLPDIISKATAAHASCPGSH